VQLADKYKQPFEYFKKLDVGFVRKLFIIMEAESKALDERLKN